MIDVMLIDCHWQSDLFQEDLYPDTACNMAAISADEWFAGRDEVPVLMSMKTNQPHHQPQHAAPPASSALSSSLTINARSSQSVIISLIKK